MKDAPMEIAQLLGRSAQHHDHLCPRQVLGVRIGLAGMHALGFTQPPTEKQLIVITETDGCFVDGLTAATGCTVGHRTLRVEDYGKVAATFVDARVGKAMRVAPALEIRERALLFAPDEPRRYFAELQAYQTMPDELMLVLQPVELKTPVERILSRAGVRVNCDLCGEEIINQRELVRDALRLCRSCAESGYYSAVPAPMLAFGFQPSPALEQ